MEPSTIQQQTLTVDPPSAASNHHDHHRCLSLAILTHYMSFMLTRFHAGYFRIGLSLGSQALLWKNLIEPTSHNTINPLIHHIFHRFHPATFISLWSFSLLLVLFLSMVYLLRCFFHPHLVKDDEFLHSVGVNYLFAPWASWLLLLQCAPLVGVQPGTTLYLGLWWALVVPVVGLDIKIYGQWFTTKGHRCKLTAVANPTSQMTVIGNLVGSRAAALMGWNEIAMGLFSLGMVHYLVVFVTLYQRLSGSGDNLPAMLRPVFFLFFAAPGAASLAWGKISGRFDTAAKMLFFLSLFLFTSLICRPNLFKKAMKRFNMTWWAYPFPLTILAIAATEYAEEVRNRAADVLMLILVALSMLVTFILVIVTVFNTMMLLHEKDLSLNSSSSISPEPDQLPTTTFHVKMGLPH